MESDPRSTTTMQVLLPLSAIRLEGTETYRPSSEEVSRAIVDVARQGPDARVSAHGATMKGTAESRDYNPLGDHGWYHQYAGRIKSTAFEKGGAVRLQHIGGHKVMAMKRELKVVRKLLGYRDQSEGEDEKGFVSPFSKRHIRLPPPPPRPAPVPQYRPRKAVGMPGSPLKPMKYIAFPPPPGVPPATIPSKKGEEVDPLKVQPASTLSIHDLDGVPQYLVGDTFFEGMTPPHCKDLWKPDRSTSSKVSDTLRKPPHVYGCKRPLPIKELPVVKDAGRKACDFARLWVQYHKDTYRATSPMSLPSSTPRPELVTPQIEFNAASSDTTEWKIGNCSFLHKEAHEKVVNGFQLLAAVVKTRVRRARRAADEREEEEAEAAAFTPDLLGLLRSVLSTPATFH